MSSKIYVGNLNYSTSEETLHNAFSQYGEVLSVAIIKDKFSQRSKGFSFIEMADADAMNAAISDLNDSELDGRNIRVNQALERERRPRRY